MEKVSFEEFTSSLIEKRQVFFNAEENFLFLLERSKDKVELLKRYIRKIKEEEKEEIENQYKLSIERMVNSYHSSWINLLREFCDLSDDLELVLKKIQDESLKQMLNVLYKKAINSLERKMVKIIKPEEGEEFNPSFCSAVDIVYDKEQANKIIKVHRFGYVTAQNHIIKEALVTVGSE